MQVGRLRRDNTCNLICENGPCSVRHAETEGDSEREKGHVNPEPVEDESRRQMGIGVSEQ